MKLAQLLDKKVALWGFGLEGQASLAYLQNKLPDLVLTILCPENEAISAPAQVIFDHQTVDATLLSQFDVVIKSPGISPYQAAVTEASTQFTSATALWFANEREHVAAKVIAITGTKGKSTSAAMLAHVLQNMGFDTVLAGNFGVPLLSQTKPCDFVVLETSSYQAYDGQITADVGLLLNLYSEHLDWHQSEAQYHRDKWRVVEQAGAVVLNADDANSQDLSKSMTHMNISYFAAPEGFYVLQNSLMYQDKALMSLHGWSLKGRHNLLNAAAVCQVISVLGLAVMSGINHIKSFKALPHRLQDLGQFAGVTAINDSISSTPKSTMAALDTVTWSKTVLLVGGFDRGLDWQCFVDHLGGKNQRIKQVICSGQNGQKIHQMLQQALPGQATEYCQQLKSAVKKACDYCEKGDVILLSPGAPSFDAFANYQQRGVQFKAWIKEFFMS